MTDLILFNIEFYRIDEIDEWIKMKWVWIDWNATNEQPIFFYIIVDWLIIILISQFMNLWYLSTCKIKWFSSNLKSDFILHWFWWIQMKEKKNNSWYRCNELIDRSLQAEDRQKAAVNFARLLAALESLGIADNDSRCLWSILAAVYHLGVAGAVRGLSHFSHINNLTLPTNSIRIPQHWFDLSMIIFNPTRRTQYNIHNYIIVWCTILSWKLSHVVFCNVS